MKKCIEDQMRIIKPHVDVSRVSEEIMSEIMEELSWFPEKARLYSKSGCKKIANKVALVYG